MRDANAVKIRVEVHTQGHAALRETCCLFFFFLLCICLVASSLGLHRREKCTAGLQLCRKDGDQIPPNVPASHPALRKSAYIRSHINAAKLLCAFVFGPTCSLMGLVIGMEGY